MPRFPQRTTTVRGYAQPGFECGNVTDARDIVTQVESGAAMTLSAKVIGGLLLALLLVGAGGSWYFEHTARTEYESLRSDGERLARRGERRVRALAYSPDGAVLACGLQGGKVLLHNAATGCLLNEGFTQEGCIRSLAFSPDGQWLVAAGGSSARQIPQLVVWNWRQRIIYARLDMPPGVVQSVTFSRDGQYLAASADDGSIHLWQTGPWQRVHILRLGRFPTAALAFDPQNRFLAAATDDGQIALWRLEGFRQVAKQRAHAGVIWSLAFSRDGRTIATCGQDGSVRVWYGATLERHCELDRHSQDVRCVAFTPDGACLLAATGAESESWCVRRWDVLGAIELTPLTGHKDLIYAIAVAPDGRVIATGSGDATIRLWDARTGEARLTIAIDEAILSPGATAGFSEPGPGG